MSSTDLYLWNIFFDLTLLLSLFGCLDNTLSTAITCSALVIKFICHFFFNPFHNGFRIPITFSPWSPPSHRFLTGPNCSSILGKFVKQMKLYDVIHVGLSLGCFIASSNLWKAVRNLFMCKSTSSIVCGVTHEHMILAIIAFKFITVPVTTFTLPPGGDNIGGGPSNCVRN